MTASKPEKTEEHADTVPRSRRLFQAGFKTRADAERCMKAIASDLAADRIGAMEANQLTGVTLQRMRDFDRRAHADAQTRKRVKKPAR
jgi:hypothetical protein